MVKDWKKPVLEVLSVNETMQGGHVHDIDADDLETPHQMHHGS